MKTNFREKNRFLISPTFAAIVSYSIFLLSFIFPSSYYENLVGENNYIFLDPASFLLITGSTLSFFLGIIISRKKNHGKGSFESYRFRVSGFTYIIIPVFLSILFSFMSIRMLLEKNPFIIEYMILGDGANIKRELVLANTMAQAAQFSICISLWATVNYNNLKLSMGKVSRFLLVIAIFLLAVICIINATLKMARFEMMPLLLGLMVVFLNQKYKTISNLNVIKYMVFFFIAMLALFSLFSFMRGFDSTEDVLSSIIGYTVTSYNHMAAALGGNLEYFYPGAGYYLATFLSYIPLVGDSFTYNVLGWPHPETVRYREFMDTYQAGLNGNYIWLTVFGYVWVSLKMWTPLFMFLYGIIVSKAWESFKQNEQFGLFFYPWMFFCIMFWLGSNILVQQPTISVFFAFLFIQLYDAALRKVSVR